MLCSILYNEARTTALKGELTYQRPWALVAPVPPLPQAQQKPPNKPFYILKTLLNLSFSLSLSLPGVVVVGAAEYLERLWEILYNDFYSSTCTQMTGFEPGSLSLDCKLLPFPTAPSHAPATGPWSLKLLFSISSPKTSCTAQRLLQPALAYTQDPEPHLLFPTYPTFSVSP